MFCGSGGVGKTSVAAASAVAAATRIGGKVLVLTIDPARRLADALGLEAFGNIERRVDLRSYTDEEPRGELYAAMLDTKRSWDELVLRHAPDEETAYRILDNRLYHNVTARFVQSHDYIAMERLFDLHASGVYDLIVIDTPPTRNAIDFLEAPARMSEFFGGRLLRWLTMPYRISGARGRADDQRGEPAVLPSGRPDPREPVPPGHRRVLPELPVDVRRIRRARRSRSSSCCTIAARRSRWSPRWRARRSARREQFCEELTKRDFHLGALVLNKTLPEYLLTREGEQAATVMERDSEALGRDLAATGDPTLADAKTTARVLRTLGDSFRNYEVVARREAELRAELSRLPEVVVSVPNFESDIADVAGLARIGDHLFPHASRD